MLVAGLLQKLLPEAMAKMGGLAAALGNDGLHPNRDGYAAMRPLTDKAINQAGKK
jgi:lysophospholipase L1-like esterase